jgi:hypothetical protein
MNSWFTCISILLQSCPPWEGFVRYGNLEELAEGSPALPHIPHQQPVSWYVRFHLALKKGTSIFIQDLFRSLLSLGDPNPYEKCSTTGKPTHLFRTKCVSLDSV